MTQPDQQREFLLHLRADVSGWWFGPEHRLRAALKALGRRFGLRVVSCRPLPVKEATAPRDKRIEAPE